MVNLPLQTMDTDTMDTNSISFPIDGDFYHDNHPLSEDIWKKFETALPCCLPTPPASPMHDAFSEKEDSLLDLDSVLEKDLHSIDDKMACQTLTALAGLGDFESLNLTGNLIQDCMWSAPGLVAAGLLPDDTVKKVDTVDENSNTICSIKKLNNLDINTKDCVDPASVFPCSASRTSSRNVSPDPLSFQDNHYDLALDTPSASSESDDEEIDVVTVAEKKHAAKLQQTFRISGLHHKRPQSLSLQINNNKHPLSTTLPATTSVSAQVAAMHNYSSTTSQPKALSNHHKLVHSYSAPPTPSNHHHHLSSGHKRLRTSYSSPSSPQSSSKRQKMVVGESDLKAVARKLSKRSNHHHHHHHGHGSRSSSDLEDNTELGKRAYHNVLERKRRDDLRASFHHLRDNVPEISNNERAPKMVILNKAMDHIQELNHTHKLLSAELQRQQQTHEQLKRKLSLCKP